MVCQKILAPWYRGTLWVYIYLGRGPWSWAFQCRGVCVLSSLNIAHFYFAGVRWLANMTCISGILNLSRNISWKSHSLVWSQIRDWHGRWPREEGIVRSTSKWRTLVCKYMCCSVCRCYIYVLHHVYIYSRHYRICDFEQRVKNSLTRFFSFISYSYLVGALVLTGKPRRDQAGALILIFHHVLRMCFLLWKLTYVNRVVIL